MLKKSEKIVGALLAICCIIFSIGLFMLNILPTKLLALVIVAIVIIVGIVLYILLGKKGHKRKIVALILAILLMIGLVIGSSYIFKTISFMDGILTESIETHSFYVVVKSDSKYMELADIKGMDVSVMDINDEIYHDAWKKLESAVDVVNKNKYKTFQELANALLDGKTEVIFINSVFYDLAIEEVEGFNSDTVRILSTIDTEKALESINRKIDVTKDPFSIYISGIDTTGSISNVSRSDVNMVVTVNPVTKEILLTSIPRDYYVVLAGKGAYDKLTHSGIYGINETVSTVENLLDTDIDYYVKVNFTTVVKLVDALGGITVNSDYSFSIGSYNFVAGENYLNGEEALAFARERYSFESGDRQRVRNQQAVIAGILQKATSSTSILSGYNDILSSLEYNIETNFSSKEITSLVKMQLDNMSPWTIDRYSLNGSGDLTPVYSMPNSNVYVMVPDQSTVDGAKAKINEIFQ